MRGGGDRLHRPAQRDDRPHGREDLGPARGGGGGRPRGARDARAPRRRERDRAGGGEDRLPRDAQGGGGRRRQGPAARGLAGGAPPRPRPRALRGAWRLRRRQRLSREGDRAPPARGDPGARGPPRPRRPPLRARVLDPEAAPEGDRGKPVPPSHPRAAGEDGRARGGPREAHRLRQRGDARVPRGRGPRSLVPRDEHASPGRAPGDRDGDRRRPREGADPDRAGRAAGVPAGGPPPARARHRVPRLCRGPRRRLPPEPRHDPRAARAGWPRRARRLGCLRGLDGPHRLRPAPLEAGGLGGEPGRGRAPHAPRGRGVPGGRGQDDAPLVRARARPPRLRGRGLRHVVPRHGARGGKTRRGREVEIAVAVAAIRAYEERRAARQSPVAGPAVASAWGAAGRREAHGRRLGSQG